MISPNLQAVRQRLQQACVQAGRAPDAVRLLAVSKTFDAAAVLQAVAAGQTAFGENYVQEGVDKIAALKDVPGLVWHCIGPLQSNKTRPVAEHFDWVHSVDRLKIAQRLSEQRPADLPPLNICLQVNIDGGPTKAGVSPSDALALAQPELLALAEPEREPVVLGVGEGVPVEVWVGVGETVLLQVGVGVADSVAVGVAVGV